MIVWENAETEQYNALFAQVHIKLKTISMELLGVREKWVKSVLMLHLNMQIVKGITKPPHLDVQLG